MTSFISYLQLYFTLFRFSTILDPRFKSNAFRNKSAFQNNLQGLKNELSDLIRKKCDERSSTDCTEAVEKDDKARLQSSASSTSST